MLSSSNVKDKKTDTPKEKGKAKKHSSPAKALKPSVDSKLEKLDQKWSERFNRLEVTLLSRVFQQPEPFFQPVVYISSKTTTSRCCR